MANLPASDDSFQMLKANNSLVTLLRMVAGSDTRNDYHRIENNFLYAALHMNVLKSVVFAEDQVPDLPKDVHKNKYL